jgi:hypothetical protein
MSRALAVLRSTFLCFEKSVARSTDGLAMGNGSATRYALAAELIPWACAISLG